MPSKKVVLPLNGSHITGILDQVDDSVQTRGRPIALILHGTLAHKVLFPLSTEVVLEDQRFEHRIKLITDNSLPLSSLAT